MTDSTLSVHDMKRVQNIRIDEITPIVSPAALKTDLPTPPSAMEVVYRARETVCEMIDRRDDRLLVVVGPCSIHDPDAALEYARRLVVLKDELADRLCIFMRVYFEKPRTTIGWKGLINDPHLNGTNDIAAGLRIGRKLLLQINELGLPAATEVLDPITPQYMADLVSWAAIGARTTESQTHREMASGLSMPVGFKNGTNGNLQIAIDAIESARHPHSFIGIDGDGVTSVVKTKGNPASHVVLRGGGGTTNYEEAAIAEASATLRAAGLDPRLMVDCSHANSEKKHERQEGVLTAVVEQRRAGNKDIMAVMIESNLNGGNQKLPADLSELKHGVSITDACVDWETTERMLRYAHAALADAK